MPFFYGERKSVSTRRSGSPVPVQSSKMIPVKTNTGAKKPKKPEVHQPGKHYHRDDDLNSQADLTYNQQAYRKNPVDNQGLPYRQNNDNRQGQPWYPMQPEQEQQYANVVVEQEELTSVQDLSVLPPVNIYEHILLLRKHGMTVRLDRGSAGVMIQQGPVGQQFRSNNNSYETRAISANVHNPSSAEIQDVDNAITIVMRRGAELDIPGLEAPSVIQCNICFQVFSSLAEKHYHCDSANNLCQLCEDRFECNARLQTHKKEVHRISKVLTPESPFLPHRNMGQ